MDLKGNAKANASPTAAYNLKSTGRGGKSSIVSGGGERGLTSGAMEGYRNKSAGSGAFRLSNARIGSGGRKV